MTASPIQNIRNFSIVAHIDHGKSTLADRLIQLNRRVEEREMKEQVLDSMDIELRARHTIKAQTVRLKYKGRDGNDYILNLIDTPATSTLPTRSTGRLPPARARSLSSTPVRASKHKRWRTSIRRSTTATRLCPYSIRSTCRRPSPQGQAADRGRHCLDASNAIEISAKTGMNVPEVLEAIVTRLPPPKGDRDATLKALLVDSWYDVYLGVVVLVRIVDGVLKRASASHDGHECCLRCGSHRRVHAQAHAVDELGTGEIGMLTARSRRWRTRVSATPSPTIASRSTSPCPLPSPPCLSCSADCFPVDAAQFEDLRADMGKLRLNDASFTYEMETSAALGFGFRCGFLGLLHLEIIQERLSREFNLDLIATAPSVIYKIKLDHRQRTRDSQSG